MEGFAIALANLGVGESKLADMAARMLPSAAVLLVECSCLDKVKEGEGGGAGGATGLVEAPVASVCVGGSVIAAVFFSRTSSDDCLFVSVFLFPVFLFFCFFAFIYNFKIYT